MKQNEPSVEVTPKNSRWSWANFGGDGFLVSLVFHVVLIAVAVFWVVSTFVEKTPPSPESFDPGRGGGARGERVRNTEYRPAPKPAREVVKLPNKISVKNGNTAVTLPAMSAENQFAFGGGDGALNAPSKGFGDFGAGGGVGDNFGPGKGGKNLVTTFGGLGFDWNSGLVGTFYDLKQTVDGKPTDMAPGDENGKKKYADTVRAYARSGFKEGVLSPFFRSDARLVATQFFMTRMGADGAPKAFAVPEVKPSRWLVHYTGTVKAPKSGRIRFVGVGDDILAVYVRDKLVLDAGYDFLSENRVRGTGSAEPKNGTGNRVTAEEAAKWGKPGFGLRRGVWVDVVRGQEFKMDVLIGETPGGIFEAYLTFEEAENPGSRKGDGTLRLFKIGNAPLPDDIAKGYDKLKCDMTGDGWIWQPVARRARR